MKTGSLLVLPSMGMPEPQATEDTPGIAWILFQVASCMRTTCSRLRRLRGEDGDAEDLQLCGPGEDADQPW